MEKNKTTTSVERIVSVEKSKFLSYCLSLGVLLIGWFGNKTVDELKDINKALSSVATSQAVDHQQLIDQGNEIQDLKDLKKILQEGEKKEAIEIPKYEKYFQRF
jgi:hypothetical protein